MNEACDKGEKGMPGPTSHTFFEMNEGGWSEKYAKLNSLCIPILNFLQSNPETAAEVVITKTAMISKLGTKSQMEEIDCMLEECIQRFRNAKTGTGLRVLIAEYEELMFLRTKLLTQLIMAEQEAKHISEKYEPEICFSEDLPAIIKSMESDLKTGRSKSDNAQNIQAGTNLDDKPTAESTETNEII